MTVIELCSTFENWAHFTSVSERDKWRRYDKSIVKVFAAIQPYGQFLATRGAFNKVMIILKG